MESYKIPFKGLKEGAHTFDFTITDALFERFDESEIHNVNCKADVQLVKKSTLLELTISIEGDLQKPCDRCLDPMTIPVIFNGELFVTFSEQEESESDELWVVDPAEHELDLCGYFYESIKVSLPMQSIHPDDEDGNSTCNEQMLNYLNEHQNIDDTEGDIDPRWSELKKLMGN